MKALTAYVVLGLIVLALLGIGWYRDSFVEEQAPDFHLVSTGYQDFEHGEPVAFSLGEERGKVVVLDFMAVTCASCRILTDEVLRPLWDDYGADGQIELWSIDTWADPATGSSFGESHEELVRLQEEEGVPWRHALDTDQVYRKYSAISLPKLVVVDGAGQIVFEAHGIPSYDKVRSSVDAALAGDAAGIPVFRAGLLGLALVAGVASFFSPCSVGLIPAYLGFLLQGPTLEPGRRARRTLVGGVATAAGIVAVYGGIALLLWGLSAAGLGPLLRAQIPRLAPLMAALLVVLGVLMFFQVSWDWLATRLGLGKVDGRRGFFAFGVGYGLAAFGCTGPIFLPVLLAGFLAGPGMGLLVFALYSVAVAGFVLLAAAFVAGGQQGRLRAILGQTRLITKVSAALLVGAGLYLLWFDWRAGLL